MLRLPFEDLHARLFAALTRLGFDERRASLCARLFVETTQDGVYSHGVNRFPRFIRTVLNGMVRPEATPVLVNALGALEQWDGQYGPGNLNAYAAMQRAVELARMHAIGCVALRNTNHWMRGGTYGWQAAEAGMAAMCWTNTMPNLPPWGGLKPRLGNNPFVLAVPRLAGHVVLDMAVSQFSYGALESYRKRDELLPVDGGFDAEGRLTRDPAAIEASGRPVPVGFWKGSGLSLVLDLLAATLSAGRATCHVDLDPLREGGISQVFIAFDAGRINPGSEELANEVIRFARSAGDADPANPVSYPGEGTLRHRAENLEKGIPVEEAILEEIEMLVSGQ